MTTTISRCPVLAFDHHAETVSKNRPSVLEEVRQHPVFFTESHGGYWVVAAYELANQVLRDPETFSSLKREDGSGGVTIPTAPGPRILPAEADGEYHRKLKKIVLAKFDKRAIDAIRPMVERLVTDTIDRVIEKRDFDVAHDLADVIPPGVIVSYLGFSDEQRVPFIQAVQDAVSCIPMLGEMPADGPTPEMAAAVVSFQSAVGTINELAARRRQQPADDIVSYLVAPEQGLSDDEVLWLVFTLILGGAENPAALIANTLLRLSEDPALRDRLIAHPELLPAAYEEFLREVTPGLSLGRNVTRDVELGGQQLRAGDRVLVWLPAANHDSAVFDAPDDLNIDRGQCRHIAFGKGPHMCPGQLVTRLEFELVLSQVLTRMPNFKVDAERAERFDDASLVYGWRTMPATTGL
jgi:cytochrome P450